MNYVVKTVVVITYSFAKIPHFLPESKSKGALENFVKVLKSGSMAPQKHPLFTIQAGVELSVVDATWKGQSAPIDSQTVLHSETLVSILEMRSITTTISIMGKCVSTFVFQQPLLLSKYSENRIL